MWLDQYVSDLHQGDSKEPEGVASSNQLQDVHNKTKRKISGMLLSAWFYGVICLQCVSLTATKTGIALH